MRPVDRSSSSLGLDGSTRSFLGWNGKQVWSKILDCKAACVPALVTLRHKHKNDEQQAGEAGLHAEDDTLGGGQILKAQKLAHECSDRSGAIWSDEKEWLCVRVEGVVSLPVTHVARSDGWTDPRRLLELKLQRKAEKLDAVQPANYAATETLYQRHRFAGLGRKGYDRRSVRITCVGFVPNEQVISCGVAALFTLYE